MVLLINGPLIPPFYHYDYKSATLLKVYTEIKIYKVRTGAPRCRRLEKKLIASLFD